MKETQPESKQPKKTVMRYRATGKKPAYANAFATGMDLPFMNEEAVELHTGEHTEVFTGVHVELPRGTFGLVAIRSGLGRKGLMLSNGIGIIDEDYRGEIRIPLYYHGIEPLRLEPGERVAQMVIIPYVQADLQWSEDLSDTKRGQEGFGSSGRF